MRPLRCPDCRGNIIAESDFGGNIVELVCLACGRSPGEFSRDQFARETSRESTDRVVRASTGLPVWASE